MGDWVYKKEYQYIRIFSAAFKDSPNTKCYVKYTAPDSKDGAPKFELEKDEC